jgi:hypothetical protein
VKYELSTGNNSVENLAWDPTRNALYATTECKYINRMGNHHGYRKVQKVLKSESKPKGGGLDETALEEEGTDSNELLDSDGDEDDGVNNWPERAYHSEDYFGYMFDAADHRVCESLFHSSISRSRYELNRPRSIRFQI